MKRIFASALVFVAFLCLAPVVFCQESSPSAVSTIEGRLVSKQGFLTCITQDGLGYLIKPTKTAEKIYAKAQQFAGKDFDLTLSGILTGERKRVGFTDYTTQQASEEEYLIFELLFISAVREKSIITNTNISKPKPVTPPKLDVPAYALKKINGKVSKYNAKSIIPTIELEGKPNFVLMLPKDAEVIKAVGNSLMSFKSQDIVKEGIELDIWYEENGNLRTARIITAESKDITENK